MLTAPPPPASTPAYRIVSRCLPIPPKKSRTAGTLHRERQNRSLDMLPARCIQSLLSCTAKRCAQKLPFLAMPFAATRLRLGSAWGLG